MTPEQEEQLAKYRAARDQEDNKMVDRMWSNLTRKEQILLYEGMTMAFVLGVRHAGGTHNTEIPPDSEIVKGTLVSIDRSFRDLYPNLAALDNENKRTARRYRTRKR